MHKAVLILAAYHVLLLVTQRVLKFALNRVETPARMLVLKAVPVVADILVARAVRVGVLQHVLMVDLALLFLTLVNCQLRMPEVLRQVSKRSRM